MDRRRARLGIFALTALAAASAAVAQTSATATPAAASRPPMATPAPQAVFPIKGFKVTGDNPLGDGETSRVLAPFLRADASIETLQKATAVLEQSLRDHGYGLHRVSLPPQEVGDVVTLHMVRFTVGKVAIEGRSRYDEGNIRGALPELREGASPNFRKLAIQTAIANESPNRQLQVGLRESEQPDQIDATITVKEQRPWTFGAGLSNGGTDESGRDRFTVTASHTNLFNLDHQLTAAYTTSLERPGDVRQFGLSYRAPIYAWGGVVGAAYTRSDVVGNFGSFTSTGKGHTAGLNYTKYLPPQGGRRSWITAGFEDKVFDATQVSGVIVGVDRRSRPVTIGYAARTEADTAVWAYNADLAVNTASGRNNDLASYRSEDPRVDTVHWKALRGGLSYLAPFAGSWQWTGRLSYQYSPDVLISGEQFGLGGLGSVRGTDIDRPITGDYGVSGTLEFATPEIARGLRAIGFVDAGWLGNNRADGANKPSTDRIASAGFGLRYAAEPVSISLDYGRIVTGSRVPLTFNSAAPRRGDDRLYLNLAVRF